jgi:mannan endo-1,6-alpha-mannosidase
MLSYYKGNETGQAAGLLPAPYYWWEGGAMFDTLIQYWHLTGDSQYNGLIAQAINAQKGPNGDFMPPNQTKAEGSDDQSTWALAAMSAAEEQLQGEEGGSWFVLADAVFNEQVLRWDTATCGGGLRWQIFTFTTGYNYKNSISNGYFFQLSSRLARFTGNTTYSDWASKVFNWTTSAGFIDSDWNVFDGSDVTTNCSQINKFQFSNLAGTYITGAAHMYNLTNGASQWKSALDGLLNRTLTVFVKDGVFYEEACEEKGICSIDMLAFKGLLAHWLVDTVQMAPYTSQEILPMLKSSAQAAAKACDGGCAFVWNGTSTGGKSGSGVGEQLSALSVVQGLLVGNAAAPVTVKTGGSVGNATSTSTGGENGTQTSGSATGSGSLSATGNSGFAMGAEAARMGVLAGLLGSIAWLVL